MTDRAAVRSDAEEHLLTLLQMVNEWLRFAETKNAGFIALASLSLTGLLGFAAQVETYAYGTAPIIIFGAFLWLASLMLSIYSFLPKTRQVEHRQRLKDMVDDTDNLYYF